MDPIRLAKRYWLVTLLLLAACVPTPTPAGTPTITPTVTPTVTSPAPAATFTPRPVPSGTPAAGECPTDGVLPNPRCTPGKTDPRVTQANIQQTVCVPGYTATVRPPVSVSDAMKQKMAVLQGIVPFDPAQYEGDHLIPLCAGGFPGSLDDTNNFWDEPRSGTNNASNKDAVEASTCKAICAGQLTLEQAQQAFATDWTKLQTGSAAAPDSVDR